jgi:hypothetical protein
MEIKDGNLEKCKKLKPLPVLILTACNYNLEWWEAGGAGHRGRGRRELI